MSTWCMTMNDRPDRYSVEECVGREGFSRHTRVGGRRQREAEDGTACE